MGSDSNRASRRKKPGILLVRLLGILLLALARPVAAEAPFGFRGDGTNRYPDAKPPLRWGETTNVAWKAALPGPGNSSPVLAGGRVFVTCAPSTVVAVRASDGKVLWQRALGYLDTVPPAGRAEAERQAARAKALEEALAKDEAELDRTRRASRKKGGAEVRARLEELVKLTDGERAELAGLAAFRTPEQNPIIGTASATMLAAGGRVFAAFGHGLVGAFDLDGKLLWARHLPGEAQMHGFPVGQAASLAFAAGRLIVPLGKLRALEPETGRTVWEGPVYRDFGQPAVARLASGEVLLSPDGMAVDAADGKVLTDRDPPVLYSAPAVDGRFAFVAGNTDSNPPDPARAAAWKLPASPGAFTPAPEWQRPLPNGRWYATPLVFDGRVWTVDAHARLVVLDAKTGAVLEDRTLVTTNATGFPAPVLAGRYVFVGTERETVVLEAAPPFRQVAVNTLGSEDTRSNPVFSGKRLYLRTLQTLYAIEERGK